MFKKRHLEIKLVKDSEEAPSIIESLPRFSSEDITATAEHLLKKVAVATVAVAGTLMVVGTLGQIAINLTNPQFKN